MSIYLWSQHKIGLYLWIISIHFRVFLNAKLGPSICLLGPSAKVHNWGYFLGVLEIPDIFGV